MRMNEVKNANWVKLVEIPTKAKTIKGQIEALKKYADVYASCYTDEEIEELLNSEYCTICEDGIIVWADEQ